MTSLPVTPPRSSSNVALAVPIYYFFPVLFFYYSSSAKYIIAHYRHGYRKSRHQTSREGVRMRTRKLRHIHPYRGLFTGSDVIKRHVTPKGFPLKGGVCVCATKSCAIIALVRPLHRK
jgi:hypothetical protein